MALTDDEMRSMVRAAIARLATEGVVAGSAIPHQSSAPQADPARHLPMQAGFVPMQAGFARFVLQGEGDDGGPCVIEPTVRCNHCGYCRSYGH